MKIDILTLFPKMFEGPFDESIVKRAQDKKLVEIEVYNLRRWANDKRKTVDDRPFGGGTGMVMMIEPIYRALNDLKPKTKNQKLRTILLSPRGKLFNQKIAKRLSKLNHLILICGHYEGVDERAGEHLVDEEISIGDYVLTGGELPAMVIVDSIVRLIPKVLEKPEAIQLESFSTIGIDKKPRTKNQKLRTFLEYPQYTRPANFKGWRVPEILLSGDHRKIEEWRKKKALETTKKRRRDLL